MKKGMSLLIRNINPELIYIIDKKLEEVNKKEHRKLSRNQFLNQELKKIFVDKYKREASDQVAIQLKEMNQFIIENNIALSKILYLLIQGDTDIALDGLDAIGKDVKEDREED